MAIGLNNPCRGMDLQYTEDGYAFPTQTARADIASRGRGHRRHVCRGGVAVFRHAGISVVVEPHITYVERSPLTAICVRHRRACRA
jgi:hypothetical protein